jgi:hypothetical protein
MTVVVTHGDSKEQQALDVGARVQRGITLPSVNTVSNPARLTPPPHDQEPAPRREPDSKTIGMPVLQRRPHALPARQADPPAPRGRHRLTLLALCCIAVSAVTVALSLLIFPRGHDHPAASGRRETIVLNAPPSVVSSPSGHSSPAAHSPRHTPQPQATPHRKKNVAGTRHAPSLAVPTAPAQQPTGGPGRAVVSNASGRCIDVSDGKGGDPLQIWECSGAARQGWSFQPDGTVRALNLCMTLAGGSFANGTTIEVAQCDGSRAQRFSLNSASDLVSVASDKCVEVKDQMTTDGTRLQLGGCTGTSNQKWHIG